MAISPQDYEQGLLDAQKTAHVEFLERIDNSNKEFGKRLTKSLHHLFEFLEYEDYVLLLKQLPHHPDVELEEHGAIRYLMRTGFKKNTTKIAWVEVIGAETFIAHYDTKDMFDEDGDLILRVFGVQNALLEDRKTYVNELLAANESEVGKNAKELKDALHFIGSSYQGGQRLLSSHRLFNAVGFKKRYAENTQGSIFPSPIYRTVMAVVRYAESTKTTLYVDDIKELILYPLIHSLNMGEFYFSRYYSANGGHFEYNTRPTDEENDEWAFRLTSDWENDFDKENIQFQIREIEQIARIF